MCGIVGIVGEGASKYKPTISKMINSIKHRGPDANDQLYFDNCAFGHVRLSIIDLSSGAQPMISPVSNTAIVFNGEIYGYKKLKSKIKNYPFKTNSDTEVILATYDKNKKSFLKKLNGMFAFAIWDEKNQALVCARDRFGEKPFYYAFGKNGEFIFASEIKAILATGLVDPVLSKKSLAHYLQHLYVNPNNTIYENIFNLPPANKLVYSNGKLIISRYWEIPKIKPIKMDLALKKFETLFYSAVKKQLVADVPVGAFLSGGVDSSAVVAAASKYKKNITTISFGFGDSINELPFAKKIANKFNTNHIEIMCKKNDLAKLLIKMQSVYDEPFADSSNIPTYLISKEAKKHLKVVLTGDGGDEMLGGYDWYKPFMYYKKSKLRDSTLLNVMLRMMFLFKNFDKQKIFVNMINGKNLSTKYNSIRGAHLSQFTYFSIGETEKLVGTKYDFEKDGGHISKRDSVNSVIVEDILDYLPGDILVKIDRASMANSIELRAPFLDVDLASFCISLPSSLKVSNKSDKLILREFLKDILDPSILNRSKQGFGAPVTEWLKQPGLVKLKNKYLINRQSKIYSVISYNYAKDFIQKDDYKTWILLVLAIWVDNHEFKIK
jgi:asparagine synthase (glutamine-hydrolysing)